MPHSVHQITWACLGWPDPDFRLPSTETHCMHVIIFEFKCSTNHLTSPQPLVLCSSSSLYSRFHNCEPKSKLYLFLFLLFMHELSCSGQIFLRCVCTTLDFFFFFVWFSSTCNKCFTFIFTLSNLQFFLFISLQYSFTFESSLTFSLHYNIIINK